MKIEIPQPCHEKWDNMNPTEKGAFCLACQKEVVDFTQMSDSDIKQYFKQSVGKTCGRFRQDQLDRTIASPTETMSFISKVWLSASLFLGITSQSYAQVEKEEEKREPNQIMEHLVGDTLALPPLPPPPTLGRLEGTFTLKGQVIDARIGEPIIGVTILIIDEKQGVSTDVDGKFELKLKQNTKLRVDFLGYTSQEILVNSELKQPLEIKLDYDGNTLLGEVCITRGNLWQRFKNIFRRKK